MSFAAPAALHDAQRVLTVVQLLPALDAGGVERSTLEIASALISAGHRSIVISAGGRLVVPLLAGGSEHIELDIGGKSLRTLGRLPALLRHLKMLRPDIVHARSRLPAWMAKLSMRGLSPRPHFITTVHGLNSPSRYSAVMLSGERVIAVSSTVSDYLQQKYSDIAQAHVRVIPRGVDPSAFPHGLVPDAAWRRAFLAEFPQLSGGVLITLPGRGTRLKGHADAIDLLAHLRASGIDARLLLLGAVESGRDAYLAELVAHARLLEVDAALAFSPSRADVREVMASSALVLQLSKKPEAFGRTVVEALSLGRPVLGYAHGGVGDLLATHFPAGAVQRGDQSALLVTAQRLLAIDTPLPMQTLPTLAEMQAATLALYREVTGG